MANSFNKKMLDVLVCPVCKTELKYLADVKEYLVCRNCGKKYSIDNGIPVMLD